MRGAVGIVLSVLLLAGCGEPAAPPSKPAPAAPPPAAGPGASNAYRVVQLPDASTGRIEGRGVLERAVEAVEIEPGMGADGPIPSGSVNPGSDVGLANCAVFLATIAEGKDWPETMRAEDRMAWIHIRPGRYEPRVQWIRAGTQLAFESHIPMNIDVHGYADVTRKETLFNFAAAPGSKLTDIAELFLARSGLVFVTDDFRGGFQAYVHVSAHPYVEVTRADAEPDRPAGSYRLDGVPVGSHELVCWHEAIGPVVRTADGRVSTYAPGPELRVVRPVRVTAGSTTRVDFTLPAPSPATR